MQQMAPNFPRRQTTNGWMCGASHNMHNDMTPRGLHAGRADGTHHNIPVTNGSSQFHDDRGVSYDVSPIPISTPSMHSMTERISMLHAAFTTSPSASFGNALINKRTLAVTNNLYLNIIS